MADRLDHRRRAAPVPAEPPIVIEFLAVDADGRPISDLRPADVTVRVDNRTRTLTSLTLIRPPTSARGDPGLPLPFGSNTPAPEPRAFAIVIDDETIPAGRERETTAVIDQWLSELPAPDRVALVTVPHGAILAELTSDRGRLRSALGTVAGMARAAGDASDAGCRSHLVLQSIVGALEVIRVRDTPLNVILLSGGLSGIDAIKPVTSRSNGGGNLGGCLLLSDDFANVARAVTATGARLYPVRLEYGSPAAPEIGGLQNLAGVTGGAMLTLGATAGNALTRIARETSAHYLATFRPEPNERRGSPHQLQVRVARDAVVTRTRPDILYPETTAADAAAGPATLREALLSGKDPGQLPLRVLACAVRDADPGKLRILALFEAGEDGRALVSAMAALINPAGRVLATWEGGLTDLTAVPAVTAFVTPPGAYRIRVAATDADAHLGVADYAFTAELAPAGPLRLGGLVLGVARADGFTPRLLFGREPVATAHLEIYGGAAGMSVGVQFELASSENGRALVSMPAALDATSEADRFQASAALPIGTLPSGDFVVRAIVGLEGKPEGRVTRTFRKRIP